MQLKYLLINLHIESFDQMFLLDFFKFNKRITLNEINRNSRHARNVVIRLFSTINPTIGELMEQWTRRFENEGIPEPVESIEHIIAHINGTSKVYHSSNESTFVYLLNLNSI